MDDNASYYGGGGDEPTATNESGSDSADQESSGDAKTALINSDICPGMKVGDELKLTIERVLDSGEYEVSYNDTDSKDESTEGETAASAPPGADAACFSCHSDGSFLPLKLALLSEWLVNLGGVDYTQNVQELIANAACFTCLSKGQQQVLRLQLLCNILSTLSE